MKSFASPKVAARAAALCALFAAASAMAREPNYDEAKVAPYTLEDPLAFADGRKLKDASEWPARRKEILDIFAREMFGQPPPAPEAVEIELREEGPTLAGHAIRRQYRMWFKADRTGPFIDWLLVLPNEIAGNGAKKDANGRIVCENRDKVPVVLMLNYRGNHAILDDAEVLPPEGAWFRTARDKDWTPESSRGFENRYGSRTVVPLGSIVSRGYALLTACYAQVSPDVEVKKGDPEELAYTHIFDLWPKRDPSRDDNITSLGAWAWALSRGLDLAERVPEIDAKRSVATGSSRLGKTALLASARDERFAVCVPNQTGGGGCPLAKRDFGENVSTEMKSFPHWYCKAYAKYVDNEQAMKFDQHLLLASIAPRPLLVEGFNQGWFDARGEYLSCRAASPAWEFLCGCGLPEGGFPANYDTNMIGSRLGYVRRGGDHGLSWFDWRWTLDFADRAFLRKPAVGPVAVPGFATLVSHRGESFDAPENTLPAYRTAVERGFGFECDVYLSKDGRVFTFHDGDLKRTTGGANTNKCCDVTWDELAGVDVGNWGKWKDSKFKGTRPALLEEVLELARDGRKIYIEIKTGPEIVPYVKSIFAAQNNANPGNALFISFNRDSCKALKAAMPEYKVYWLVNCRKTWKEDSAPVLADDVLAALRETGADGVDCRFSREIITADFIKRVRDAGYEFHVWTIDDISNTLEAFSRGAQTVTTNCAKKLLDEWDLARSLIDGCK